MFAPEDGHVVNDVQIVRRSLRAILYADGTPGGDGRVAWVGGVRRSWLHRSPVRWAGWLLNVPVCLASAWRPTGRRGSGRAHGMSWRWARPPAPGVRFAKPGAAGVAWPGGPRWCGRVRSGPDRPAAPAVELSVGHRPSPLFVFHHRA